MNKLYSFYLGNDFLRNLYDNSFLSKPLHLMVRKGLFVKFKYRAIKEYVQAIPRLIGIHDSTYEPLLQLKNKYKGKRLFITCTGPSLTISDLEMLKNEYTFGMNSICMIHDKTNWKPDFFAIQDHFVFEKVKDYMLSTDNGIVMVPHLYKKRYKVPQEWISFHICGSYHIHELNYKTRYFVHFSNNAYACVYDGYSITYTIIQIAIYMGFDEIYLLGSDCSYLKENQHFIDHGHYEKNYSTMTKRLFTSFGKVKEYAEKHNIKIYNATRGGCLEMFPRVKLEDVISNNRKNKLSD